MPEEKESPRKMVRGTRMKGYLQTLNQALGVLEEKGFSSEPFVRYSNSIKSLAAQEEYGTLDFIEIYSDSGLPTERVFETVYEEAKVAKSYVANTPSYGSILANARSKIMEGVFPEKEHLDAKKRRYYEKLDSLRDLPLRRKKVKWKKELRSKKGKQFEVQMNVYDYVPKAISGDMEWEDLGHVYSMYKFDVNQTEDSGLLSKIKGSSKPIQKIERTLKSTKRKVKLFTLSPEFNKIIDDFRGKTPRASFTDLKNLENYEVGGKKYGDGASISPNHVERLSIGPIKLKETNESPGLKDLFDQDGFVLKAEKRWMNNDENKEGVDIYYVCSENMKDKVKKKVESLKAEDEVKKRNRVYYILSE